MSSTVATALLTFEEFEQLPDSPQGRYELLQGEAILLPPPKIGHKDIQMTLVRWFLLRLPPAWACADEFGLRIGRNSYLVPDFVVTTRARWKSTPRDSYFEGAPELAVEVLSPGNTAREITTQIALYFEHGAQECWIVDPLDARVTVHSIDQGTRIYSEPGSIPLTRFGIGEPLPVAAIFA